MSVQRLKRTVSAPIAKPRSVAAPAVATKGERAFVLDVPFAMRAFASAEGARWDPAHSVYVYRGSALPPSLAPFRPGAYAWERWVERELNDEDEVPSHAAAPTMTPRPHQREAIAAIIAARAAKRAGFLLADDVGLGKTVSAWESIRAMPESKTVLIVCPLAVIAHWRRTVQALGDGGRRVVLINYERLGKLFEVSAEARKKVKSKKGLARAGSATEFDVIVWDESHRCKNPAAARSKFAVKLNAKASFVLWLSATAGQNPLELSYLAPLLASVTGSRAADLKDFEQWCVDQGLGVTRGTFGRWNWRGDPADCERVHAMLFEGRAPAGLRRRPEDIAGWPELQRILTPIELDASARQLYDQAWTAFRHEMALDPRGKNPQSALTAMLRLRQKSSIIRVAGTLELARELLENGHQVAISVAFTETLTMLRDALQAEGVPCAALYGAQPAREKEAERMRFQRGDAKAIVFTVEEGISLHQGEHNEAQRSQVIHDVRWSAIQMAQIEGRCHRDGRFAQVYWTYADATLEEQIATIVCKRLLAMKAMVGDDVETLREIEQLLASGA